MSHISPVVLCVNLVERVCAFRNWIQNSSISVTISIVSSRVSNLSLYLSPSLFLCHVFARVVCAVLSQLFSCFICQRGQCVSNPPLHHPLHRLRGYPLFQRPLHSITHSPTAIPFTRSHLPYSLVLPSSWLCPRTTSRVPFYLLKCPFAFCVNYTARKYTHTHTGTHSSMLIVAFKLKGVSSKVQVASGEKHDNSPVYCGLLLRCSLLFLACAAINPFVATSKCARVVASARKQLATLAGTRLSCQPIKRAQSLFIAPPWPSDVCGVRW